MVVEVRLFATLRELAGRSSLELELRDGATVDDALTALRGNTALERAIGGTHLVVAVNREYAPGTHVLASGDELALIPPVSGGSQAAERVCHVRVTDGPLQVESVSQRVVNPGAGAIVIFQGTTRAVPELHYEAYVEMAEEKIAAIVEEAVDRHDLIAAAVEHRIGRVPLSEPSVIIAVSAAHRDAAFAGAREMIDRIKTEAPIWKKEVEGTDERWAEGTTPPVIGSGSKPLHSRRAY